MRKYPGSTDYAPTMVANGSKRHPLHSHYSRIHRNPGDDDFDLSDLASSAEISAIAEEIAEAKAEEKAEAVAEAVAEAKTRKKMTETNKLRNAAKRAAEKLAPADKPPVSKKLSASKQAEHAILEAVRKAIARATGHVPGHGGAAHAPTLKIQYVGGGSSSKKAASVRAATAATPAKTEKRKNKPMSQSKRAAAVVRGQNLAAAKAAKLATDKAAKAAIVANPRPKGAMSQSKKALFNAKRLATIAAGGRPKTVNSKSKKSASSKLFNGYKISLLKNPLTDFQIGGVKVVPALAGAAGAVALSQLVRNLSFVENMQPGLLKDLLPAAVTVAVGAAGLYYAEKNNANGMLKDLSKDLAAYGMFLGLNDAVGSKIRDMVDNLKKPAAPTLPTTTTQVAGGAFFAGGGWVGAPMPQLEGYHMSGANSGYPPAFAMNGGEGYFVPSGLALNGYHMAGDANSAATAAAITALNGGQHRGSTVGGIDLDGFQD